ncbi:unnamed protein product [Musa acuminata subsp. malaccensis]|uniref:(wild Malaysian banana) hypothetical protein n=1 Tax=Musa acuminata subsp. malaccensis TaxID=214687 RepID=A0A804KFN8_MUSAM|nr:unnamed protein product [Musa acuminata subsp. malaccensis]
MGQPQSIDEPPSFNNVLLTGDALGADEQLSYGAATFVMQRDCNLVHHVEGRRVFQSYTRGHGVSRTLSLTDCGQLVITSSLGSSIVWRSPFLRGANRGKYAAVLRPDGVVADYYYKNYYASDDYYKNLWSSNNASSIGDYALLLQINGQAVVYGPTVWLTTSSPKSLLDTISSSPEPPIAT